jgi:SsrA-binding protein|tara:strand:- start:3298 stop:3774 length:477 start_codon:yes stop_codon:yes gene_type:complete
MAKKHKSSPNTICTNRRAHFEYHIDAQFEAGLVLEGWEVKSIRSGRISIEEAYVIARKGEIWLIGANISPLNTASTHITPDPTRSRKLLLHLREIKKLIGETSKDSYTIVPLRLFWKQNKIKCIIALAKGKKLHDKRQSIKEKDWKRDKARQFKQSQR